MKKNIKKIFFLFLVGLLGGACMAAQDVGIVDLNFCNGLNHLEVTIDSGAQADAICMLITNKGDSPSSVVLSFVEGEFSHGDRPVQACKTSNNGFFGQSVMLSGENIVTLQGGETVQKYASFTKLPGFAGVLHGCITYSVVDGTVRDPNVPMAIVTRKANLIDIIVPGEVQSNFFLVPLHELGAADATAFALYGKEVGGDDKVKIFYNKPTRILKTLVGIKNDGFDDEDYKIQMHLSSFFGLVTRHEESNPAQLYAKTSTIADEINSIPRYHLFVKADISILHQPHSLASNAEQPWKQIMYHDEFFLIPWQYIALAGALFILLILFAIVFIKRRRRKRKALRMQREDNSDVSSKKKPMKIVADKPGRSSKAKPTVVQEKKKVSTVTKKAPKKETAVKTVSPRKSVKKKTS